MYLQYGCGLCAPDGWVNFDASPTLRLQKIPLVGSLLPLPVRFPKNVRYGDITKGLPVKYNSCKGVYCSHVLEHLSLEDCRAAINNTYKMLAPGGIFRLIVPDLEVMARVYVRAIDTGETSPAISFVKDTILGTERRSRGLKGILTSVYGNSHHLWMWDYRSLETILKYAGFSSVRRCVFNDCADKMFLKVEEEGRFRNAVAIEAKR